MSYRFLISRTAMRKYVGRAMKPAVFSLGLALAPISAAAQAPLVAQACLGCHGPGGAGMAPISPLAGRPVAELRAALDEFRDGSRPGTIMARIVRGYTPAEMAAVAAQFAAMPAAASR